MRYKKVHKIFLLKITKTWYTLYNKIRANIRAKTKVNIMNPTDFQIPRIIVFKDNIVQIIFVACIC